jgi:glucan phosphoethanolaminetransferase (alkaline phosphatase superfamily)
MSYQFIFKQLGNWKLYILIIVLWLTLRNNIIDLVTPYIPDFENRLLASFIIIIVLSLVLIFFYEKYFELENFNTNSPRDMNIVTPMCNNACKKNSNLSYRAKCEEDCKRCNSQL